MQPRPWAETSRPWPSVRVLMSKPSWLRRQEDASGPPATAAHGGRRSSEPRGAERGAGHLAARAGDRQADGVGPAPQVTGADVQAALLAAGDSPRPRQPAHALPAPPEL